MFSQISIDHRNKASSEDITKDNSSQENKSQLQNNDQDATADEKPEKPVKPVRKESENERKESGASICHAGHSSKEGIHVPPVKIQVYKAFSVSFDKNE